MPPVEVLFKENQRLKQDNRLAEEARRKAEKALAKADETKRKAEKERGKSDKENDRLEKENRVLRQKIDYLLRKRYGANSEKLDPAQLQLLLAGMSETETPAKKSETDSNQSGEEDTAQKSKRKRRNHPGRYPLPDNLDVVETEIIPDEVKEDPEGWKCIGEEVSEELDIIPPQFIKRRTIRKKYVRCDDRDRPPVIAPLPARALHKGIAANGLLTYITLSKYCDHIPLYRQSKIYQERFGINLPRKSMMEWMKVVADWLKPIYDYMRNDILSGGYVQADETPIRYLDPDHGVKKSRQGYIWAYGRPGGDVVFDWNVSRGGHCVNKFLNGFTGLLQSDGYPVYASFVRANKKVTHVGCWAHCRRGFHEALEESPLRAGFVLRLIQTLYRYEREWRENGVSAKERGRLRSSRSLMTVKLLHRVLKRLAAHTLPKTLLGKAIRYGLNQWLPLYGCFETGEVEIDNNLMENTIRPWALGRKNWLFIGHPGAGWVSAVIYSILQSCRRHDVEPYAYLKDVLDRLPSQVGQSVSGLTPANWKATQEASA